MSKPKQKTVYVKPDGTIQFIYDDELTFLHELGDANISRASHVEPTPDGKWTANMGPSGGPILGPFELRKEALDAEVEWLEGHLSRSTRWPAD